MESNNKLAYVFLLLFAIMLLPMASSAPAINSTSPEDNYINEDGTQNFLANVSGNITSCTLYLGAESYDMTYDNDTETCEKEVSSIPEQTYNWYITATNGTEETQSSTKSITIDIKTSAGKTAMLQYMEQEGELESDQETNTFSVISKDSALRNTVGGMPIWLIGILALLVIAIVVLVNKYGN